MTVQRGQEEKTMQPAAFYINLAGARIKKSFKENW